MARPLRINFAGAYYHVMNRGQAKAAVFLVPKDFQKFLNIVKESCQLYRVEIVAYALMGNHYHLLVHTPDANLSHFMRQVNGVYTLVFNRKYNRDGPLMRGRYKASLIQDEHYLVRVIRYIHLNPLKAGLVKNIKDYPWISHHQYLQKQEEKWLKYKDVMLKIWPRGWETPYRKFIKEKDKGIDDFFKDKRTASILGDEQFTDYIADRYLNSKIHDPEIPEKRRISGRRIAEMIRKRLMVEFKINSEVFNQSKRGHENTVRMMAVSLARDLTGTTHKEIAVMFGLGSYRTVNKYCERMRIKRKNDLRLDRLYERLSRTCRQVGT